MDRFSEAYTKAREVLNKRKYTEDWQKFLTSDINPVLGADAPDYQKATALDTFRTKLAGGLKLKSPFGTFVAPNISPDPRPPCSRMSGRPAP